MATPEVLERQRDPDEVLRRVRDENVEFVRFWFTDVLGALKSFAIPAEELERTFEKGKGFDGSSIDGFNEIHESDMNAFPDPLSFAILPWRGEVNKVGRMFCDIHNPDGSPYEGDPRYAMRRALVRMQELGFDNYFLGPELEFFLFRSDKGTEVLDRGGYFDLTTLDAASDFRRDCFYTLRELGIPVEYQHHEVGPSQHEIDMRFAEGLKMCDHVMSYKTAVKEVAMEHGSYATFMPKPLFGENGSGMHTHQSLFKGDQNAFFDMDDEWYLSEAGKRFIAGQLVHAREISALFAPNVNSYKRLVPGFEAPVYMAWSRRNRSALIRVPVYEPGEQKATRAELRCPDPSCNPYLAFAAMLHAGLEGIERGYELPPPMERNLYDMTDAEREENIIGTLPKSLEEAIEEMENSTLVRRALGDHIFENYLALKKAEWEDYRMQVTPWEFDRYLATT
jgi:glutamine synthetase